MELAAVVAGVFIAAPRHPSLERKVRAGGSLCQKRCVILFFCFSFGPQGAWGEMLEVACLQNQTTVAFAGKSTCFCPIKIGNTLAIRKETYVFKHEPKLRNSFESEKGSRFNLGFVFVLFWDFFVFSVLATKML